MYFTETSTIRLSTIFIVLSLKAPVLNNLCTLNSPIYKKMLSLSHLLCSIFSHPLNDCYLYFYPLSSVFFLSADWSSYPHHCLSVFSVLLINVKNTHTHTLSWLNSKHPKLVLDSGNVFSFLVHYSDTPWLAHIPCPWGQPPLSICLCRSIVRRNTL